MKLFFKSIGVVILGMILLGVTSGCGKKIVRGSSGSDQRVARASLKAWPSGQQERTSSGLSALKQAGLSQELELNSAQTGEAQKNAVDLASTGASGQKSPPPGPRPTRFSTGSTTKAMSTTPASTSSSRFDSPLTSSTLPSAKSFEGNNDSNDSRVVPGGLENPALSRNDRRKGVTFSNGLSDIYFEFDSWRLNEESRQILEANADWLKAHPHDRITIEGHCDERGTQAYNYVLGEKRATMVQQYLSFLGVPHHQLIVTSFGKDRPRCYSFSESCFQKNRRAHFESDFNVASH